MKRHVGYYLVDRGRTELEAGIGYRPTWIAALGRLAGQAPLASYLGAFLLVWLLTVLAGAVLGMRLEIVRSTGPAAALVLLAFFARRGGTICDESRELVFFLPGAAPAHDALGFLGGNSGCASHAGGRAGAVRPLRKPCGNSWPSSNSTMWPIRTTIYGSPC